MRVNNQNGVRGMPNAPFTVDTNRESDGVSSTSPLTTSNPSFPLYTASANFLKFGVTTEGELQGRKDHAARVAANQALQGIAAPEAGEAEVEAAAVARLQDANASQVLLPSLTFQVDSFKPWNPSAFPIQQYEMYRIEVPTNKDGGDQKWIDGLIETNANG